MREFVVKVDKAKLARNNSNVNDIMWRLRSLSYARDEYTTAYIDNEQTSIVIRPKNTVETSIWEMQNYPVQGDIRNTMYRYNMILSGIICCRIR